MDIIKYKLISKLLVISMMILNTALLVKGNISSTNGIDLIMLVFINVVVIVLFSSPYLFIYKEIAKIQNNLTDIIASCIGLLIISIVSTYFVIDIKSSSDAQSGISLIIVPPLQFIIFKIVTKIYSTIYRK